MTEEGEEILWRRQIWATVEVWLRSSSTTERFSSRVKGRWFLMTRSFPPSGDQDLGVTLTYFVQLLGCTANLLRLPFLELCCPSAHCSNRSAPNYKNSKPLVITLRLPLYPDQTLGERIKKWRLERGLFQVDLAKKIGVSEMTIVNWEKGRTKPIKQYFERLKKILGDFSCS